MDKKNCIFCDKSIKKYSKWNDDNEVRNAHRSCWLKNRPFEDRYGDYLFCPERTELKKYKVYKPVVDIGNNLISVEEDHLPEEKQPCK